MAGALIWPVKVAGLIRAYTRAFGPTVTEATGKTVALQRREQARLALTHALSPEAYYTFALYQPDQFVQAILYLHHFELTSLQRALDGGDAGARQLEDKLRLAGLLQEAGVPTVPCCAVAREGRVHFPDPSLRKMPATDVFIKPIRGSRGVGAMLWECVAPGLYRSESAAAALQACGMTAQSGAGTSLLLYADDLVRLLERLSLQQPWIVQERVRSHPALADLAVLGAVSIRLLTGRVAGGSEALRAVLQIPLGRSVVSNSGLLAPIDCETGILGRATIFGPSRCRYTRHPDTGAEIEGRVVPQWQDCLHAAQRAHACFPDVTFIGWDVVVTPSGPIVLEGNWGWDPVSLQKPHGKPLLDGRFAEICLARLDQRRVQRSAHPE